MLDYAFNQFTNRVVYKRGEWIGHLRVDKGEKNRIEVRAPRQFSVLMRKGESPDDYQTRVEWKNVHAPVRQGQVLGTVKVIKDGKTLSELKLLSAREIPRAGLWKTLKRTMGAMLFIPEVAPAEPGT